MKSTTWKVFAASMAAGQVLSPVLASAHGHPPFTPELLGLRIVLGLFLGAWLLFSAWTWRRLARMRDAGGHHVYNWGVLGWGVPMWVTLALMNAADEAGGVGNLLSGEFAGALLTSELIHFPLALWGGWFFGVVMAGVFGTPQRNR
ncbi:MAG TPA: hypothetical protein VLK84_06810 [Longimicrobium sp.]|nr:hypothetical protein [Longimicrobium sp.]